MRSSRAATTSGLVGGTAVGGTGVTGTVVAGTVVGGAAVGGTEVGAGVAVGGANFAMYTQNDGAWIKNVADEAKLLDAMRKGADMTVRGESGRGTKTTDTYSLKGIAQALDKVAEECR